MKEAFGTAPQEEPERPELEKSSEHYEAKPSEDGHYGDQDFARHFTSQLEPKSEAEVLLHLKACEACRKRAERIGDNSWTDTRESFKGF